MSFVKRIPEFCMSHWLLRIPLAIVFIQQGLSKLPVTLEDAEAFELPYLVWWVVAWGELGAGVGLLVAGLLASWAWLKDYGDVLTRFCGITICSNLLEVLY